MWTPALIFFFFIPGVQFKLFFSCSVIVTHLWVAICLMWSKRGKTVEGLTISTIFCRAGARVEAGGACLDWVLLGWGHIGCWTVLRKQIRWYKSEFRCIFIEDGDKTTSVCTPYLSRYEVGRSLWWAGEGQLLPWDHHHLRPGLINMRGRHRPRAATGRDAPWRTARWQVGSVVVIGLDGRQGSRRRGENAIKW